MLCYKRNRTEALKFSQTPIPRLVRKSCVIVWVLTNQKMIVFLVAKLKNPKFRNLSELWILSVYFQVFFLISAS
jgi:hypothetical protein